MRLFSNRSQTTSNCGKNIIDTLGCTSCATFLFLPHFDVIYDLLLNRRKATWNPFVNYLDAEVSPCPEKGGRGGSEEEVGVPAENGHGLSELEMFEVEILTNLLKKLTVGLQTWMLSA